MRTSVLDLGSNSFHVLVADLDGHHLSPVMRQREMLHLGRVVARHGTIPPEHRTAAVATVAHLTGLARRVGAQEHLAVATSALRDADNGPAVIDALSEAAGTDVRILDGRTEARLAYLGVRAAVAVRSEPVLVLDLGGGSLEFAVGVGDRVVWSASTRLGASRLSALVTRDPLRKRDIRVLTERVDEEIDPLVDVLRSHHPGTTVAVGGTVRALARIAAVDEAVWLPATLNQLRVSRRELDHLRDDLVTRDLDGRLDVPGMKEQRADHLHVAAIVLTRVLERLGIAQVTVSDWGLREAILLDAHGVTGPPGADDLRSREVERMRLSFVPDDPHPAHVAHLAAQVFDGTRSIHGRAERDRGLLEHAAHLHAVGESLALRRQQQHGAYLVENAELRGFDPAELALLATLVRFHPSRGIDRRFPPYASLSAADQERTRHLLAILQIADGLDRAHDQAVTDVTVKLDAATVELHLDGDGLHVTADELTRRTRLFERTFDVTVQVHDQAGG